ncbi:hypothetical protein QO002_002154 [Pararhizobium capsulatum DSM 1112]|uniref:Transposase n=1 Tax=Pararhizobium capsulatum DSM 1112 TaxID=1121113 RepID=A0ABU0BQR1_9HYPH|nr:hypothetical protein [Pararhizobium capsulatum]MDQ0320016.1 hypothetical protein [Pararhizobium capsulatum DSM 1112]
MTLASRVHSSLIKTVQSQTDTKAEQIIELLCAVYPRSFTARKLMGLCGFALDRDPLTPFVEFINLINRINHDLRPLGWQARRTGGTPDDHYRLSPYAGA